MTSLQSLPIQDLPIRDLPVQFQEVAWDILETYRSEHFLAPEASITAAIAQTILNYNRDTKIDFADYDALRRQGSFGDSGDPYVFANGFLEFAQYLKKKGGGFATLPTVTVHHTSHSPTAEELMTSSYRIPVKDLPEQYRELGQKLIDSWNRNYFGDAEAFTPVIAEEVFNPLPCGLENVVDANDYEWMMAQITLSPHEKIPSRTLFWGLAEYLKGPKGYQSLPPIYRDVMPIPQPHFQQTPTTQEKLKLVDDLFSKWIDADDIPTTNEASEKFKQCYLMVYDAMTLAVKDNPSLFDAQMLREMNHYDDIGFLHITPPEDTFSSVNPEDAFSTVVRDLPSVRQFIDDTMVASGDSGCSQMNFYYWLEAIENWNYGLSDYVENYDGHPPAFPEIPQSDLETTEINWDDFEF